MQKGRSKDEMIISYLFSNVNAGLSSGATTLVGIFSLPLQLKLSMKLTNEKV